MHTSADEQKIGWKADAGSALVVDDDGRIRKMLRQMLEGAGMKVAEAGDGEEALRKARENPPDVVLLDIMMPGVNGFEVCKRMKTDLRTATIPVLMITSLSDRSDRIKGIEAGAIDFLSKPADREEVLLRVRNSIQAKRLFDRTRRDCAQLRRLEELRDDLTQMIVHDMRRPLTVIGLELEIQKRTMSERGDEQSRYVDAARDQVGMLMDMANSLLEVTGLESGRLRTKMTLCDPASLAQDAVRSLKTAFGNRRIAVAAGQAQPLVLCHQNLISRVLSNMARHALEATPENSEITITVTPTPGSLRICVSDARMDEVPAEHGKPHDRFGGQGPAHLAPVHEVSGLGLSFCKLVVEAHGGKTGVDSYPGKGVRLWFELPMASESARKSAGKPGSVAA